jgi:zinc D-Ala-D-Ala carboxypeptidase
VPSHRATAVQLTKRRRTPSITSEWVSSLPADSLFEPAGPPHPALQDRPPTSPYLPEGVVDTRPEGLRMAAMPRAAAEWTEWPEWSPEPVDAECEISLPGVVDSRPATGALPVAPLVPVAPPAPVVPSALAELESQIAALPPLTPYPSRSELRRRRDAASTSRKGTGSLSMPQVGIASALGLATIAAPLTGSLNPPSASANLSTVIAKSANRTPSAQPAFPLVAGVPNAVEAVSVVTDDTPVLSVPAALSAPARILVTRVSRRSERAVLPGCDGVVPAAAAGASNGELPSTMLCTLWDGDHQLRVDAAIALARLNVAYRQDTGRDLCLADAYRTLAKQYAVKATRGGLAATPGRSEHGWGLAIDLCGGQAVAGSATYTWLRANGPRYGWDNPDWARTDGRGPYEPWHFEYVAGETGSAAGE